jgi:hypothetical protein
MFALRFLPILPGRRLPLEACHKPETALEKSVFLCDPLWLLWLMLLSIYEKWYLYPY